MSIPAQPDRDSDLIIAAGLNAGDLALAALSTARAAIGLDQLAKLAEQAIADHSVCVNEGCPDERIIPPSLRWFVEEYLPAALADGAAPRAPQAGDEPAEPCWLCQDLGGVAVHEKWSAERGKPLWTAHAPGSTLHPVYPCPACAVTAKPSPLLPPRPMTDEEAAAFERKWSATTPPRASQGATATHSTGDDAGAAHDPHKPAAGHTEPRMRPEDVPAEWVKILLDNIALTNPDDELDIRYGLGAVIPAIRAAIADEITEAIDRGYPMPITAGIMKAREIARGDQ